MPTFFFFCATQEDFDIAFVDVLDATKAALLLLIESSRYTARSSPGPQIATAPLNMTELASRRVCSPARLNKYHLIIFYILINSCSIYLKSIIPYNWNLVKTVHDIVIPSVILTNESPLESNEKV
jgi:hypothetical protein